MWYIVDSDYLMHYGIKGMRKGSRRWTNADGSLNAAGKARYGKKVGQTSPSSPEGKYSSTTGLIEGHSSTGFGTVNAYSGEYWENGQSQGRVDPDDVTVNNGNISAAEWLQNHAEMRKRRRRRSKQANKDRFFVVKQGKNKSSASSNRPVHREKQITTSGGAYKRPAK